MFRFVSSWKPIPEYLMNILKTFNEFDFYFWPLIFIFIFKKKKIS